MANKCLEDVLSSSNFLREPSAPMARGWLEEYDILGADRAESFFHDAQCGRRIVPADICVEGRNVSPSKQLNLSFSYRCAVDF